MSDLANSQILQTLITKCSELAEMIQIMKAQVRGLLVALDDPDRTISSSFASDECGPTVAEKSHAAVLGEGPRLVVDSHSTVDYTTADRQEHRRAVNVLFGDVLVTIAETRTPMYTLSSLAEHAPGSPAPTQEGSERLQIVIPVPKSEPNLESSFVFPQTGSKDIDGRGSARKEGSIPEIK
jgi:hypothetical protein